jgi:hypothetical protein
MKHAIKHSILFFNILLIAVWIISNNGCSRNITPDPQMYPQLQSQRLPVPTMEITIPHLSNCTHEDDRRLRLNEDEPVTVLVHGCKGSAGKFLALANVFAFHGQQTVCFNYDDRDSMMVSSAQLIDALETLISRMNNKAVTVIGHSQGGLVTRKAFIQERSQGPDWHTAARFRLVTISSPFAGVSAAEHCGSRTLTNVTLGVIIPICRMISGDKWFEITSASDFIRNPGTLSQKIDDYTKIVTDERDSCRRRNADGQCVEDDYVFSVAEQYYFKIDSDPLVDNVEVKAGHMEIVGDENIPPTILLSILQDQGILATTPPQYRKQFALVLQQLY